MRNLVALSLLCLASLAPAARAGDLLQLVVIGTGGDAEDALAEAKQDSAPLLSKFVSAEGSSYKLVAPGGSLPVDRRNLRSEEEDERKAEQEKRKLDTGCPNQCSNSGSKMCQQLGCAFCGKCNRRRRHRSLVQQSGVRTASEQRQIEQDLQDDLDKYCVGRTGCKLHARVLRVNDDGTASRAN